MVARHTGIVHQAAILPPVGAGGVQAEQRRALARLLDIDAVRPAGQLEMHITTDDRFEIGAHAGTPSRRSLPSASLK